MAHLRAVAVFLAVAALAVPRNGQAAEAEVGFLGVLAPDVEGDTLRVVEGRIEETLGRRARVRRRDEMREALARDPAIARALAEARASAAAGNDAMLAYELPLARAKLDEARGAFEAAHGKWLAPEEYGRVVEQRARLFYALRLPAETRAELARLLPLRAKKSVDADSWPPDALAMFEDEREAARSRPFAAPDAAATAALAERSGVRWLLSGEARRRDGFVEVGLVLGSTTGTVVSRVVRLAPATTPAELDRELGALLDQAGVITSAKLERSIVTRPTPAPTPAPSRKPWYIAGALLLGAAAAGGIALSTQPTTRDNKNEPAPDPEVSIIFEAP